MAQLLEDVINSRDRISIRNRVRVELPSASSASRNPFSSGSTSSGHTASASGDSSSPSSISSTIARPDGDPDLTRCGRPLTCGNVSRGADSLPSPCTPPEADASLFASLTPLSFRPVQVTADGWILASFCHASSSGRGSHRSQNQQFPQRTVAPIAHKKSMPKRMWSIKEGIISIGMLTTFPAMPTSTRNSLPTSNVEPSASKIQVCTAYAFP
ncbi:hypothetical protein ACLKA6_018803 [Drosophila palustris]